MVTNAPDPALPVVPPEQEIPSGLGLAHGRLDYVDGLRAFAAVLILFYHAFQFFFVAPKRELTYASRIFSTGHVGVAIFVVLSGFCLSLPFIKRDSYKLNPAKFMLKRAWRILPPYYILVIPLALISLTPIYAKLVGKDGTDAKDFIFHLLLIHNWFVDHVFRIAGHLWSVALEFQLYLTFIFILPLLKKPKLLLAVTFAIGLPWWIYGLVHGINEPPKLVWTYWYAVPSVLFLLALGMVAAKARVAPKTAVWLASVGVAFIALGLWLPYRNEFGQDRILFGGEVFKFHGMFVLALGAAMVLASGPTAWINRALSWKPIVYIGERSFTLYLIHMPIIRLLAAVVGKRTPDSLLFWVTMLSAAVTAVASILMYPLIEAPFAKISKRVKA